MIPSQHRFKRIFDRPLVWLALLIPLLVVGHWLCEYWPSSENAINANVRCSTDLRSVVFTSIYLSDRKSNKANSKNFQLDLETGRLRSIADIDANRLVQDAPFRMTLADESVPDESQSEDTQVTQTRMWTVWCKEADGSESSYPIELPGEPRIVNNQYVLVVTKERLSAWKLGEPNATPITYDVASNNAFVLPLPSSSFFVLWAQGLNSRSAMSEVYQLTDNKIRKIGEWPKPALRSFCRMGEQAVVVVSNPDGSQEVRSLENNEVIPIQIDPSIDLTTTPWSLESATATVLVRSGAKSQHFEFGTWRLIPRSGVEGVDQLIFRQAKQERAYYASTDLQRIVCIHDRSGKRIWSRDEIFTESLGPLGFLAMGDDKLLIHGHSENPEAVVLNSATGETISKSQPMWAIRYVLIAWFVGIVFWWIGWFGRSVRDDGWAWLDSTCFLVFVIVAMAWRVLWSGDPLCDFRVEYRIAQGASAAGLALTSLWIIFGQTRWTLKMLPPIAWLTFVCSMVMVTMGWRSWAAGATLVSMLFVLFWMLFVCWMIRTIGFRLAHTSCESVSSLRVTDRNTSYPLRDIFLVTIAVAILFSVLRFVPLPENVSLGWGTVEIALNCYLMAVNTTLVAWCALSNRPIWVRWPLFVCSPLLCAFAGVAFQAWLHNSTNYPWMALFHGVVQVSASIAVFMSLHTYRWRGWRLGAGQGR